MTILLWISHVVLGFWLYWFAWLQVINGILWIKNPSSEPKENSWRAASRLTLATFSFIGATYYAIHVLGL